MKKLLVFFAVALAVSACGQKLKESEVTAGVKEAFHKQFTGVEEVKWEKENDKFEVNFEQNDEAMSAVFTPAGVLEGTEVEIKKDELPASVVTYISQNYKGSKIKEAARITKANGEVNYEAEVKGNDLIFDPNGNFLKSVKD